MSLLARYKKELQDLRDSDSLLMQWGVIAMVAILVWSFVIVPFSTWKTERFERIEQQAEKEQRLISLKESVQEWRNARTGYEEIFTKQAERFFQSAGPVAAQGELQGILSRIAQKYELRVVNQASYDPQPESGLGQRLPVSIMVSGNTSNIIRFVADVSAYPKLLVIEQALFNRQRANEMNLTLNVSGFMLGGGDE
jgi:Tfp pilus assembly protein PilO